MRGVADFQIAVDLHTEAAQALDLFEQRFGIDHHTVAEQAELSRMEDPRWDQLERVVLIAETNRVPGVVTSLIACHDVERLAQ